MNEDEGTRMEEDDSTTVRGILRQQNCHVSKIDKTDYSMIVDARFEARATREKIPSLPRVVDGEGYKISGCCCCTNLETRATRGTTSSLPPDVGVYKTGGCFENTLHSVDRSCTRQCCYYVLFMFVRIARHQYRRVYRRHG